MTDFVIVQAHDPSVTKYRNINDSQLRNLGCHCEAEGRSTHVHGYGVITLQYYLIP